MKKEKNYLEYVPSKNSNLSYRRNEKEMVIIQVERNGFFDKLSQWLFFAPKVTYIKLDIFGSFIWNHIDGNKNIYELGKLLEKRYGKEVNPIYERLSVYFEILKTNELIDFL